MKILAAKVNTYPNFDNSPSLNVLVDKLPSQEDLRFEQNGSSYFAELDGYIEFYHYSSPGNGYGGRTFQITMKDGSIKDLIGPWSSNSQVMKNRGFQDSCSVGITDDPKVFQKGYTFYAGHISVDLYINACIIAGVLPANTGSGWYIIPPCEVCNYPLSNKCRLDGNETRRFICKECQQDFNIKDYSSYENQIKTSEEKIGSS